jgi:ribosome modulation factor
VTGGRASRQKGNRLERAIVRLLQDRGFAGMSNKKILPAAQYGCDRARSTTGYAGA